MSEFIFILLIVICFGLIYIVHRYLGKHEFYLLTVIYSILSLILSFKLVNIFGLNINLGIIFTSGLLTILYYFINRYGKGELRKFIMTVVISTITTILFILITSLMIPSINDEVLGLYQNLFFDNLATIIIYPIVLIGILILSSYSFRELKLVEDKKILKTILTLIGIIFIDVFAFMYFSYAIIITFNDSLFIALDNYLVKIIIMIIYYFGCLKIMKAKKVKS